VRSEWSVEAVAVSEEQCSARIETSQGWADIEVNERAELGPVHLVSALDGVGKAKAVASIAQHLSAGAAAAIPFGEHAAHASDQTGDDLFQTPDPNPGCLGKVP
jgi:hypothetical protein